MVVVFRVRSSLEAAGSAAGQRFPRRRRLKIRWKSNRRDTQIERASISLASKRSNRMVRWIHITDLQFGSEESDNHDSLVEGLIAKVRGENPDFVVNSGDNVAGAIRDDEKKSVAQYWREYRRVMDPLARECPLFCVPGNHDQTRPGRALDDYCRHVGRPGKPPYYAANFRDIHLVMLDTVLRPGLPPAPVKHMGGFLPNSPQNRWLRRHLSKRRRARAMIAVGHWPIFASPCVYFATDSSLRYDELTGHRGTLLPQLAEAGFDLYLCGHHHVYERSRHPLLMQVMTGADGIAYPEAATRNRYCVKHDDRHGYTRFTYDLSANKIRGEALALSGDVIDAWSQNVRSARSARS